MHRITIFVTFATVPLLQSAGLAQETPVLNPYELIGLEPKPTEISCVEHLDLPVPIGRISWRDFPPKGLLEELPQTKVGSDWVTGMPLESGDVAGPQLYSYDGAGRIAAWTSFSGDFDDPMAIRVRTSYTYGDLGRVAEQVQEFWRDGSWVNYGRSSFAYSDAGPVSRIEFSVWTGSDWEIRRAVDCQNDDTGRLTRRSRSSCVSSSSGDPNPVCEVTDSTAYFYDDLGRISEADGAARDPFRGWRRVRSRFEYDGAGRLTEAVNPGIDPLNQGDRYDYSYDSAGRLSDQEIFRDFAKRRLRYSYQHRGALTRIAEDSWVIGPDGWIERGETRYDYDAGGALETVTRYPGDPEFWSQSRYRYDDRDQILGETRSGWTGTAWRPELETAFEYDASGQLLSYTELWDSEQRQGEFRLVYSYAVGTANSEDLPAARSIQLKQNYPNPVRTRTTIVYTLSRAAAVRLSVFDVLGRTVRRLDTGRQAPGSRSVELDASDLLPGVYLYRLEANDTIQTGNMVVAD